MCWARLLYSFTPPMKYLRIWHPWSRHQIWGWSNHFSGPLLALYRNQFPDHWHESAYKKHILFWNWEATSSSNIEVLCQCCSIIFFWWCCVMLQTLMETSPLLCCYSSVHSLSKEEWKGKSWFLTPRFQPVLLNQSQQSQHQVPFSSIVRLDIINMSNSTVERSLHSASDRRFQWWCWNVWNDEVASIESVHQQNCWTLELRDNNIEHSLRHSFWTVHFIFWWSSNSSYVNFLHHYFFHCFQSKCIICNSKGTTTSPFLKLVSSTSELHSNWCCRQTQQFCLMCLSSSFD